MFRMEQKLALLTFPDSKPVASETFCNSSDLFIFLLLPFFSSSQPLLFYFYTHFPFPYLCINHPTRAEADSIYLNNVRERESASWAREMEYF